MSLYSEASVAVTAKVPNSEISTERLPWLTRHSLAVKIALVRMRAQGLHPGIGANADMRVKLGSGKPVQKVSRVTDGIDSHHNEPAPAT